MVVRWDITPSQKMHKHDDMLSCYATKNIPDQCYEDDVFIMPFKLIVSKFLEAEKLKLISAQNCSCGKMRIRRAVLYNLHIVAHETMKLGAA